MSETANTGGTPDAWLPPDVWSSALSPSPDADHYVTVFDHDLGCLVEVTTADGQRFYGVDSGERP